MNTSKEHFNPKINIKGALGGFTSFGAEVFNNILKEDVYCATRATLGNWFYVLSPK